MSKATKPLHRSRHGDTHHRKLPDTPPKPGTKRVEVAVHSSTSGVQAVMQVTLPTAPWERREVSERQE